MKYSLKGSIDFGFGMNGAVSLGQNEITKTKKTLVRWIKFLKIFGLKSEDKSDEDKKNSDSEGIKLTPHLGFKGKGKTDYELSAEVNPEELVQLFKLSADYDLHVWEMVKTIGRDVVAGTKSLRKEAESEAPAWVDLYYKVSKKIGDHDAAEEKEDFLRSKDLNDFYADHDMERLGKKHWRRTKSYDINESKD